MDSPSKKSLACPNKNRPRSRSISAIKSRLYRIRRALREYLMKLDPERFARMLRNLQRGRDGSLE